MIGPRLALALLAFSLPSLAHPGDDLTEELAARAVYFSTLQTRALSKCDTILQNTGLAKRIAERREKLAATLRQRRKIQKRSNDYLWIRDASSVAATEHHSNASYSLATPDWVIFGDSAAVLSPEVTEGPYYVDGEYIREDVTEGEQGVPLYVDLQIIDMNTCMPVENVAVDFWHCNSTGVYSGVVANGNGNGNDNSNLQNKALRGIQLTDVNGTLQFTSVFPGHYTGRATHIHLMTHINATKEANSTISGGSVAHAGQLFFDQNLIAEVETVSPYSTNTQTLTLNSEDQIFSQEAASSDPVAEYVLLGDTISDGVLAWLNFGIDPTYSRNVSAASTCSESGCVANKNSGGMGGMGGPPGSGTPPGRSSTGAVSGTSTGAVVSSTSYASSGNRRWTFF